MWDFGGTHFAPLTENREAWRVLQVRWRILLVTLTVSSIKLLS